MKIRELKSTNIVHYFYRVVAQITKKKGTLKTSNWCSTVSSYKYSYFPIYRHNLGVGGSKCPPPPPMCFLHKIFFFGHRVEEGLIKNWRESEERGVCMLRTDLNQTSPSS